MTIGLGMLIGIYVTGFIITYMCAYHRDMHEDANELHYLRPRRIIFSIFWFISLPIYFMIYLLKFFSKFLDVLEDIVDFNSKVN